MQSHRRELRRPRSSNSSAAARGAPFRAASSVYSSPLSSRSASSLSSRSSRSGRGRQRSTFARTGQGLLTQRERQRTGAGAPQRFTFDLRKAIKAAEVRCRWGNAHAWFVVHQPAARGLARNVWIARSRPPTTTRRLSSTWLHSELLRRMRCTPSKRCEQVYQGIWPPLCFRRVLTASLFARPCDRGQTRARASTCRPS